MSHTAWIPRRSWQPGGLSVAQRLATSGRAREFLASLSPAEASALRYKWNFWARPAQLMPPDNVVEHEKGWKYWNVLAGRGYGKTRVAAEAVRSLVDDEKVKRIALIGPTYRDVVQTMIKGESGLMSVFPEGDAIKLRFVKNDNTLFFNRGQKTIATAFVYTGEEPERLRGPQHDFAWFDELGAFKYLKDVWQLFAAGHRIGANPRAVFTTTPRASLLTIDGLLEHDRAVTTFGKSSDNRANLASDTIETLEGIYQDTEFADQELGGVLYLDNAGALFQTSWISKHRVAAKDWTNNHAAGVPINKFYVVVDPSGSEKSTACECGVVLMGLGADNNAYMIEDLSKRGSPDEWASVAVRASAKYNNAVIIYETNYGGGMVGKVLRDTAKLLGIEIKTRGVDARENKAQRAMKASPLVQRGRVRLVGYFSALEKQLTTWEPGSSVSPDRLDAFVWGCITILLDKPVRGHVA